MRRFLILPLAACLASCTVGPDFSPPAPPEAAGYGVDPAAPMAGAQRFVPDRDIPADWWRIFGSAPLDALIEEALRRNSDLAAAQSALRAAQETARAATGAYFPTVSASLSPSRNKTATGILSPASASGSPYYSLTTAQVTVSYVPDVFGLNQRTVEGLEAQAEMQRFQLEATRLSLTSNLVTAVIQTASLRDQLAAAEQAVAVATGIRDILRRQQALGQVAVADVLVQETALAQAQQAIPPLRRQLAQSRDQIAALAGRLPSEAPALDLTLAALTLPADLPVSLPAALVAQRPDIRAAAAGLHAASAQVGVAVANRLPSLTLTADAGSAATGIGDLLGPGTAFWTIAGTIAQPVFAGGTLLHRQRAAEAAFDQAAAQYRGTVITACQGVADVLNALALDGDAVTAAGRAEQAAGDSLAIARRQLALGQISGLTLLTVQQAWQQARLAAIQARAARLTDTAALYQALGGGWWNRPETAEEAPQ